MVVSRSRQLDAAPAQPATEATPRFAAGAVVGKGESQPRLGIAAARVVTSAGPVQSPAASPEEPTPEAPTPVPPAVTPAPVPVSAPEPPPSPAPVVVGSGSETPGPIAAGGGTANVVQVCEGDDYTGFYLVLFDGLPVERGDDPVPVEPDKSCAQIDLGFLLGEPIEAGTEIHIEAVTLGEALEPVVP